MLLYLLILFFLLLGVLEKNNDSVVVIQGMVKKRKIRIAIFLSFVILLFFYSARGNSVGWDTNNYFVYFNHSDTFGYDGFLEKGWIFLMKSIHFVSSNHVFYQIIIGCIGIGAYYYATGKLSLNLPLSITLYFMQGMWFNLMNQQRTAIASCICMISLCFLVKKRYIYAIIVAIIAQQIHDSAIVFLGFILFDYLFSKNVKRAYWVFGVCALFVTIFYKPIYSFLVARLYPSYTTEPQLVREMTGGNLKMMIFFLTIAILILLIDKRTGGFEDSSDKIGQFFLHSFIEKEREKYLFYLALLFSLFFQFISVNNTMIARFSNYFSVYLTILVPNVLSKVRSRKTRAQYTLVLLLLYFVYMVIYLRFSENGFGRDGVIPYVFINQ